MYVLILAAIFSGNTFAAEISMIKIIANPSEYSGSSIRTFGYLSDRTGLLLSLTSDHVKDDESSIIIQVVEEMEEGLNNCIERYVEIEGKFLFYQGVMFIENVAIIKAADELKACLKKA